MKSAAKAKAETQRAGRPGKKRPPTRKRPPRASRKLTPAQVRMLVRLSKTYTNRGVAQVMCEREGVAISHILVFRVLHGLAYADVTGF